MFRSKNNGCVTQLIDGSGKFNDKGLDRFLEEVKFSRCGINYAVVAIMGPQSSGKSTLLNHLFHTEFREMNAEEGRSQTTQGIWMARCDGISPFTIAMDLEGSDGRERGQDDTAFEKQSALFALAIADIVLINIWCIEIGREQAANRPLLRTVFHAMMRVFGNHRKTTLLFVIRDKSKSPLEKLKRDVLEDVNKIWNEIPKRAEYKCTTISQLFRVEVVALPSYEDKEEKFKEEVDSLRNLFANSTSPGGLAGDRRGNVTASAFSLSAQHIWKTIKDDRDLHLPSHKVMLATVRCEEILKEKLAQLIHNADWLKTKKTAETGLVPDLGKRLGTILSTCLYEYDEETMDFDETVRRSKRELLKSKLLDVLYSAFINMLGHKRFEVFNEFKQKLNHLESIKDGREIFASVRTLTEDSINKFDKGCSDATIENAHWDASSVRDKLLNDMEVHANFICNKNIIIQEVNNINLQNQEKSQELINRIIERNEEERKAAEARMAQMMQMHARDQGKMKVQGESSTQAPYFMQQMLLTGAGLARAGLNAYGYGYAGDGDADDGDADDAYADDGDADADDDDDGW